MNMKDSKQMGTRLADTSKGRDKNTIDAAAIRELAGLLEETGLTEIELEQNGVRLRVSRQQSGHMFASPAPAAAAPAAVPVTAKVEGPVTGSVPSPMVGTAYVAPEPGKPAFVKVGDTVKEGDTLMIVEAMKTMNPILSPRSGTVKEICIHDAEPVEFGQTLLVLV